MAGLLEHHVDVGPSHVAAVDYDHAVGLTRVAEYVGQRRGRRRLGFGVGRRDEPQAAWELGERRRHVVVSLDGVGEVAQADRPGGAGEGGEPAVVLQLGEEDRGGAVPCRPPGEQVGERGAARPADEAADRHQGTAGAVEGEQGDLRPGCCWAAAQEGQASGQGCGCHLLTPHPCAVRSSAAR
jgi:hypothetical protein